MLHILKKLWKLITIITFLLLAPGLVIGRWCNIKTEEKLLFRMSVNITYYTAIVAVIFIIDAFSDIH